MSSIYDYLKGKGYFGDDEQAASDDATDAPVASAPMGPPVTAAPVAAQYQRAAADTSAMDAAQARANSSKRTDSVFNHLSMLTGAKDAGHIANEGEAAQQDADRVAGRHKQGLADILTADKLQQEGVDRQRATTKYGQEQEGYQHGLERRPTLEGQKDTQAAAELGLTGAKTGEANAAAGSSRATTAKSNYDLTQTKNLDDPTGNESTSLRSLIYSQVPDLQKIGALDNASFNGMKNGPYKEIVDTLLNGRAKTAAGLTKMNTDFRKEYDKTRNAGLDSMGKIDDAIKVIDEAEHSGGLATKVAGGELAKSIVNRVTEGELKMFSGDPSVMGRLTQLYQTAVNGKMTEQNAKEFRDLLQSKRDTAASLNQTKLDNMLNGHANVTGQDPDILRAALTTSTAPAGKVAVTGTKHFVGDVVTDKQGKKHKIINAAGDVEDVQ